MDNTDLPFTDRMLGFPLPDKFKMPCVDKYDGDGDPAKHVENLRAHFFLHGTLDEIACRMFPLTMAGIAKDWLARLPTKSVDNFKNLGHLFLGQFLVTWKRRKNPGCLLSLRQGKEETLKDFMLKFNREKLMVESPNDQTVLSALWHEVRSDGL